MYALAMWIVGGLGWCHGSPKYSWACSGNLLRVICWSSVPVSLSLSHPLPLLSCHASHMIRRTGASLSIAACCTFPPSCALLHVILAHWWFQGLGKSLLALISPCPHAKRPFPNTPLSTKNPKLGSCQLQKLLLWCCLTALSGKNTDCMVLPLGAE